MQIENFRAVVYNGTTEGTLMAECLETGAMSSGRNMEEALRRMNSCHIGFLVDALEKDQGPLSDRHVDNNIKDLIRLGIDKPFYVIPSNISERYLSLMHCYDKTNLPAPKITED